MVRRYDEGPPRRHPRRPARRPERDLHAPGDRTLSGLGQRLPLRGGTGRADGWQNQTPDCNIGSNRRLFRFPVSRVSCFPLEAAFMENALKTPDLYWRELVQLKAAAIYTRLFRNRVARRVRTVEVVKAISSSS